MSIRIVRPALRTTQVWIAATASLAAETGVSRATLTRRFAGLVGRPPMGYLTWWRLTRAAALLRDTTDPLPTIAEQAGYANPYVFSHAFKKHFGTSPGRYRNDREPSAVDR